jgi:hypothetical protein
MNYFYDLVDDRQHDSYEMMIPTMFDEKVIAQKQSSANIHWIMIHWHWAVVD